MNRASVLGSAALCLSAMGWAGQAHALNCADLPNPLYVAGSSAVSAVLGKVAPVLSGATGADQLSIVYISKGSCAGVGYVAKDATPAGACSADTCVTGAAVYWPAGATASSMCDLAPAGNHVDVALSDVYKDSCVGLTTTGLTDQNLLVLPFGFIVPKASGQEAIDAREAYFVYGRGMTAGITPWTNPMFTFQRNGDSGTQITVFKNIHVPTGNAVGFNAGSTGAMLTMVGASTAPEQTLGFIGLDLVDTSNSGRTSVKALAYRHWGQSKYYFPDSTNVSFDKKNVRDGHFPLWGYEHAISPVNGPNAARAQKFVDVLTGKTPVVGADVVALEASAAVIPLCAMEVSRTSDGGDFSLVTTGDACSCAFEKSAPSGAAPASCKACTADTECTTPGLTHCRHGFCEAR
ncbi:MAG: hypothetical protein JWN48_4756 [Myxococcaceae bacterium]|nr:hypothetical protein [Myxococcaceae bacterium]